MPTNLHVVGQDVHLDILVIGLLFIILHELKIIL